MEGLLHNTPRASALARIRASLLTSSIEEYSPGRWDRGIEILLLALLAFAPLALGTVQAWSEEVVLVLTAGICLCFALKYLLEPRLYLVRSWVYLPLALFLMLPLLQLLDWPASLVKFFAPGTYAIRTELVSQLPPGSAPMGKFPLSFYPYATLHDFRLVLALAAVFFVVLNTFRTSAQIKRLLLGITLIGSTIALLALSQVLLGNGKIYWCIPAYDQAFSGPFINHSHFGQYMNLSIGAAMGLLLVLIHEKFAQREVSLPIIVRSLGAPGMGLIWICTGAIVLGAAMIFISLTRGGMVSLLIAGGLTTAVLALKRNLKGRNWLITTMALGSFACVLYIGFDAVYNRLGTLREINHYEGRWDIIRGIGRAMTRFPLLGAGLGTHEVVYPMFDRESIPALASHAENEYAQAAEETGCLGLALILFFAAVVWRNYITNIRHVRLPIRSAAFGLGFGLCAIMIHSLSDFGQHLPANALLTTVTCALLVGLARLGPSDTKRNHAEPETQIRLHPTAAPSRLTRIIPLALTLGLAFPVLLSANSVRIAAASWDAAQEQEKFIRGQNWLAPNEAYSALISSAQAASALQPDNIQYRHWLPVYRWHAISRVTDPNSGQVILSPSGLDFARRIKDELLSGLAVCPVYGPSWCVAGQIEYFILEDKAAGAPRIRTGFRLTPYDQNTSFIAGQLDTLEGKLEDSREKFARVLKLGARFEEIAEVYLGAVNRPDLALALAGEDINRLGYLARRLSEIPGREDLAARIRAEATLRLKEKCTADDAPAGALAALAGIYRREKNFPAAAEFYRRALALDYGQVDWRMALAATLVELGQPAEALHEARICLRIRPQMPAAIRLIEKLSVAPAAP